MWGPAPFSRNGFQYNPNIVDHFKRFTWIFPLNKKYDILTIFQSFIMCAEQYFNTKTISLQTDAGGKFHPLTTL